MLNLQNYQSLLRDTITYLESLEDEFIEISDLFLKKTILSKVKTIEKQSVILIKKDNQPPIKHELPLQVDKPSFQKEENIEIIPKAQTVNNTLSNKETIEDQSKTIPTSNTLENKKIQMSDKPQVMEDNFNDIKNIFSTISPNTKIFDEILDDKIAKQKAQKYKLKNITANLAILAYKESEKHYKFLEKIAIALNNYFYPTKVVFAYAIEKENTWKMFLSENEIFLIIACDNTIFELSNLKKYYKENPSTNEKYIDNIPLVLLPDLSIYFKEPGLKASLFKMLQQKIVNLKK